MANFNRIAVDCIFYNKWQDEIKKFERKKDYLRGRSEDLLPIYEAHSRGDS